MPIPYNPLRTVMPDSRMPAPDYTPEHFGAGSGRALQGIGDKTNDWAQKQMALNDEAEAKDADMEFQRRINSLGFDPENGYFAKMGKGALDSYMSTQADAKAAAQEIAGNIKSARARDLFQRAAAGHMINFTESMSRHSMQQRKLWLVGTSDARANETIALAANFWNDDKRFNQAVATARDEALQQGELQGWSEEQKQAAARAYESKAWVLRITALNQTNPIAAGDMYAKNAAKLEPTQSVQLSATLKQSMIPVQTRQAVDAIMSGAPTPAAGLIDAVMHAESRGKDFAADGTILTSSKGAKGRMQVLDSTNTDPGFGVVPAKDDSVEERARVGREYLQAMVQRYGNQSMALAAYNWGPGRVDGLVEQGIDPRRGGAAEALFMSKLPDETRAYVEGINKRVPPQEGKVPTSRDIDQNLPAWMAQAEATAKAMFRNDPVAQDQLKSQLIQKVSVISQGNAATERQARDTLLNAALGFQEVAGNGTQLPVDKRPKTLQELLAVPGAQDAWAASDANQKSGIMKVLEANAQGKNATATPEAFAKYYELLGQATNDPVAFRAVNMSDPKLVNLLPQQWVLSLMAEQKRMASREERELERGANLNSALSLAKQSGILRKAGINVNAKPESEDAARLNQFTGQLQSALDQFVQQEKRQPTQKDQRAIIGRLLTEGYDNNYMLWANDYRLFEAPSLKTWRAYVPPAVKANLAKLMEAELKRPPMEDEMIDEFTRRVRVMGTK